MTVTQDDQALPLFYKALAPLNSGTHQAWRTRTTDKASWMANQHAVPLTTEEFAKAQRFFPIIFSSADKPVPLALMGLNEGANVYVGGDGAFKSEMYIPAYARRYPFLLARLAQGEDTLSLCVDPTSDLVGEFDDGEPLFVDAEPSERCKSILDFCTQFEVAAQQTTAFVDLLLKHDLLTDGEFTIQRDGDPQPSVYRGFKMVTDAKLNALPAKALAALSANGTLRLIHLHQASLGVVSEIFTLQSKAA
jgi:hypothetical protein